MGYKIAIASTDGVHVDGHFGSSRSFYIVEVDDDGYFVNKEERIMPKLVEEILDSQIEESNEKKLVESNSCESSSCKNKRVCGKVTKGSGCSGQLDSKIQIRVSLISDCRCLICKNIGQGAERQLQKQAITAFQIDNYKIEEALIKIIGYYNKIDNHISLRALRTKE
jgi:predicted Fe-Mo cluster-binding NifX family protein